MDENDDKPVIQIPLMHDLVFDESLPLRSPRKPAASRKKVAYSPNYDPDTIDLFNDVEGFNPPEEPDLDTGLDTGLDTDKVIDEDINEAKQKVPNASFDDADVLGDSANRDNAGFDTEDLDTEDPDNFEAPNAYDAPNAAEDLENDEAEDPEASGKQLREELSSQLTSILNELNLKDE